MDKETAWILTSAAVIIIVVSGLLVCSSLIRNECIKIIHDKPAIEIALVCKS